MKNLIVASYREPGEAEQRVLKLANWMGAPAKSVTIDDSWNSIEHLFGEPGQAVALALSLETLARLRRLQDPARAWQALAANCAELLVFSFGDTPPSDDTLLWLTGGRVRAIASPETRHDFHLPAEARSLSKQFAGLSFQTHGISTPSFELAGETSDLTPILTADAHPLFLRVANGPCDTFLLTTAEIADIGQPLSQERRIEDHYDQLVPLLIFLRHSFGTACWHGPAATARLIVDDPLLKPSYGFLDYKILSRSMAAARYGTSIAFIPWNHWRTSKRRAPRLFAGDVNLSICVHGCDHTNKEFDVLDQDTLDRKANTALHRMERHEQRTGIEFERVMVFPQGRFSSSAIAALRSNDYLAAVNTTCFPTNDTQEVLTIADFLRPAVVRFSGFPIFQRRYPRRLIDCAFDLFLGKPLFLVEHHQYFRDGCKSLEEFVERLHALEPALAWETLSSQLVRSCAMRDTGDGRTAVQFFTRRFQFRNDRDIPVQAVFEKYEPDPSRISSVTVDGTQVPFSFHDEFLSFDFPVGAGRRVEITVADRERAALTNANFGLKHALSVSVRRFLSELRDNTLTKHPRLLELATSMVKNLKATGEDDREAVSSGSYRR